MAFASLNGVYSKDSGAGNLKDFIERTATKIEIPRGVSVIGHSAFYYCDKAEGTLVIPEGVTEIGQDAFNRCMGITEIELPESLKILRSYCFSNMRSLKSLVLPSSVTEIPAAIVSDSSIESFRALGEVVSVGGYAFAICKECTSYDFTACTSVPTLANINAFNNINPDADIFVPSELYDEWIVATNWAAYADYIVGVGAGSYGLLDFELNDDCESFSLVGIGTYDSMGELTDLIIPEKHEGLPVTSIAPSAFEGDISLGRVTIPSTVTSIGAAAFSGCTNLAYAYIPESVTSIGESAFADCSNLTEIYFGAAKMADCASSDGVFARAGHSGDGISVVIGKEVEKIPTYLFYGGYPSGSYSSKVMSVEFEEGSVCAEIGDGAFYYCLYLEEFKAPANLERIGNTALYHGDVLDFSACTQVPVLTDSYPWAVTAIYVPAALYDQWIVATNWAQYADKIVAK